MTKPSWRKFCGKHNMSDMKLLFDIGSAFALIPRYDFNNLKFRSRGYNFYVLIFLGLIYFGYANSWTLFKFRNDSVMQTSLSLITIFMAISNILIFSTAMLSTTFLNKKELEVLFRKLVTLDRKLAFHHSRSRCSKKTFILKIIFIHIVLLSIFGFEVMVMNQFHVFFYKIYLLCSLLLHYQICILIYIIVNIVLCIKHHYIALNDILDNVVTKQYEKGRTNFKLSKKVLFSCEENITVKNVDKMFIDLNETVELFNTVYGWAILFLNIYIINTFLFTTNNIIVHASHIFGSFRFNIVILLIWATVTLIMVLALARACDQTIKEACRTSFINYRLLQLLPVTEITSHERDMREDLLILSERLSLQTPHFSAAGFFDVDFTMIFAMLGTIASYTVVLIEFS